MKSLTFLIKYPIYWILFFFTSLQGAYCQSWYVDKNSSLPGNGNGTQQNPFKSISAAIAAANAWGANPINNNLPKSIFVAPAVYTGDINMNITTGKLTIIGKPGSSTQKGPELDAPVLDGENQIGYFFNIGQGIDSVTISGFYFKNLSGIPNLENPQVTGNTNGTAIHIVNLASDNSNFIKILDNHFENINTPILLVSPGQNTSCPSTGNNPNLLGGAFNNLLIQSNIIKTTSGHLHGIYLENVSNALIDNNTIEGNAAVSAEVGLEIAVRNNSYCPNATPSTLFRSCQNVTVSNNTFHWNQHCNLVFSIRVNKTLVPNFQNTTNTIFQNISILNNSFKNNNSVTANINSTINDYLWGGRLIRLSDYGVTGSSLQNITLQNNSFEYFITQGNNFDLPSNTAIYLKDAKGANNFNENTYASAFSPLSLSVAAETDPNWLNTFRSVRPGAYHALSFDYRSASCDWAIRRNTFSGHDINKANDVGAAFQFYYLNQTTAPVSQKFQIEQNYVSKFRSAVRLEYWLLGSQLSSISLTNNHLAGNRVGVVNNSRNLITATLPNFTPTTPRQGIFNASFNWWGDNTPENVANYVDGVQSVGGSSGLCPFAPGATFLNAPQPSDLIFSTLPNVDYSPWLDNGNDVSPNTPGFQGDFSYLHVDRFSPQAPDSVNVLCLQNGVAPVLCSPGSYGRVGEALEQITENGTLMIYDRGITAYYSEDYINQVTKNVKFASNGTPIIDNLRINTANTGQKLTLLASLNVSKLLDLQKGKIDIGDFNLTLVCYPQVNNGVPVVQPIISGGNDNSYVITEGTGMLRRDCVGGGATATNNPGFYNPIKYAVGTSNFYAPLTLRNTASNSNLAPDRFGVRVIGNVYAVPTVIASPFSSVAKVTWFVDEACPNTVNSCTYTPGVVNFPNTFPTNNVTLSFEWPASVEGASFNRNSSYVKEYTSNGWIAVPDAGGQPTAAEGIGPYKKVAPALTGQFINKAFAVFSDCPSPPQAPAIVARCDSGPLTITFAYGPLSNPPVMPTSLLVYGSETGGTPIATFTSSPATFTTPSLALGTSQQYWLASGAAGACESKRVAVLASAAGNPGPPIVQATTVGRCQPGVIVFTAKMGVPQGGTIHLVADVNNPDNSIIASSSTPNASGEYTLSTPFLTQTVNYGIYVTAAGGCKSPAVPVQAVIAPPPGPPMANNTPICGGGNATITAMMGVPAGNIIRLYASITDNTPVATANNAPYLLTASTSQTVTWFIESFSSLTGCASPRVPVVVTVNNEILGAPTLQNASFTRCGPGVITLTAAMGQPAGNQYRVYDAPSGGALLGAFDAAPNASSVFNLNIPQTGTYYIASYNILTGCESPRVSFSVTLTPTLGLPSAPSVARCGPGSVVFTASMGSPPGVVLRLYTQNSGGSPISVSNVAPFQLQSTFITTTTTFYLASANADCESFRTPVEAIVNPLPLAPNVPNVFLCNTTSSAVFSAILAGSSAQELRVYANNGGQPGDFITSDPTPPFQFTPNNVITQNTVYWFSAFDILSGCESEKIASNVLVNTPPPAPIAGDAQRCGPGLVTITVTLDPSQANAARLFTQSIGGSVVSADFAPPYELTALAQTNVTWFVEAYNTNTQCVSQRVPVSVRLLPSPINALAQDLTRCGSGLATFSIINNLQPNAEVRLYTSLDASAPIFIDAIPPFTLPTGFNDIGVTSYYIANYDNLLGCESQRLLYKVNALAPPSLPIAAAASRCGNGSLTITISSIEPEHQVSLFSSPTGASPIASSNSSSSTLTTPFITATTIFYLEKKNLQTGCVSARAPVTATINSIPADPRVNNLIICGGGVGVFTVTPSNPGANEAYLYASESATIPLSGDISAPFTLETPNISVSSTFYVGLLNTTTGCFSNRLPVLARVESNPGTPVANNVVRCGNGPVTFTVLTGSSANIRINLFSSFIGGALLATRAAEPFELTINNVSTHSTYYLEAENTQTGCKSPVRSSITATINNVRPISPQVNSVSRCGGGSVTFTATFNEPGLETRLFTSASGGAPLSVATANPALLNTPEISNTTTFWVATFNPLTGCESPRTSALATILNLPGNPLVFGAERCGAGQATLSAIMNAPAGTEMRLYEDPNSQLPVNVVSSFPFELLTPFTNATQTYYVTSFNQNTGCESAKVPVTVTIHSTPAAPTASAQTVCGSNSRATIVATPGNPSGDQILLYSQSSGGQALSFGSFPNFELVTPEITTTTVFYLEGVNTQSRCTSLSRAPVVVVFSASPAPGLPITAPVTRCGSGIVTLTVAMGSPAGNVIRLFNAPVGGQLLAQDNLAPYELSVSVTTTTTFYVSSQNTLAGCESARVEVIITVLPIPDPPTAGTVNVCRGATAKILATMGTVPGTEIRLYNRASGGTMLAQDNVFPYEIELPNQNLSSTYFIESFNSTTGCASLRSLVAVSVNDPPLAPLASNASLCKFGTAIFTVNSNLGPANEVRLYETETGDNFIASDNSSPFELPTPMLFTTSVYYIAAVNASTGCLGPRVRVIATVEPELAPPNINNLARCGAGAVTLTAQMNLPAGNQIRVYDSELGGTLLATASSAPYLLVIEGVATTSTYYVSSYRNATGCESARTPVIVTINPQLNPPISVSRLRCGQGPVTLSLNNPSNEWTQVRAYAVQTGGVPIVVSQTFPFEILLPNVQTSSIYYLEAVNVATGCSSLRSSAAVNILPIPSRPSATAFARCGPGAVSITALAGVIAGTEMRLYTQVSGGNPINSAASPPFFMNTPFINASTQFFVSAYNATSGCESERTPVTAIINAIPGEPGFAQVSRCGSGSVTFTVTMGSPPGNELALYEQSVGGIAISSDNIAPFELTTGSVNISTTYFVESRNTLTGCVSPRRSVVATILSRPAKPSVFDVSRCGAGNVTITVTMNTPSGNAVRVYSDPISNALVASSNTLPFQLALPFVNTNSTFYVSAFSTSNGCESERAKVEVTIHSLPSMPNASDVARCGAGTIAITASMGNLAGTEIRLYTLASGGNALASATSLPFELIIPEISQTTTFYLETFNGITACRSARRSVTAAVHANPSPPLVNSLERCGPGVLTFSASMGLAAGNEILLYTVPIGGAPVAFDNTFPFELRTPELSSSTQFYLEAVNTSVGCTSAVRTLSNAVIHPVPQPPFVSAVNRCGSGVSTFTIFMGANGGEEVRLYTLPLGGTPIAIDRTEPFTLSAPSVLQTTSFYVAASIGSCESERSLAIININSSPTPPIVQDFIRCGPGVVTLSAAFSEIPGSEVRLYNALEGGQFLTSANAEPLQLTLPFIQNSTTFYLSSSLNLNGLNCESLRVPVAVRIIPTPLQPNVSAPSRCGAGSLTLSVAALPNFTGEYLLYTQPVGGNQIQSVTSSPYRFTINLTTTSTFYVAARNQNCEGERTRIVALLNQLPDIPSARNVERCGPGPITLTANMGAVSGTELRLYDSPTSGNLIAFRQSFPWVLALPFLQQTTTFYLASRLGECESERIPFIAEVTPQPSAPFANNIARCGAGPVTISANMGLIPGTELRVYDSEFGGNLLATRSDFPYQATISNVSVSSHLFIASANGSCESSRSRVAIQISVVPSLPLSNNISVCGVSNVTITGAMGAVGGTEMRLYDANQQLLQSRNQAPYNFAVPSPASGVTSYYLAAVQGSCESERKKVEIITLASPPPPSANNVSVCGAGLITLTIATQNNTPLEVRVYDSAASGNLLAFDNTPPYTVSLFQASSIATYYASTAVGNCESVRRPIVVQNRIRPAPPVLQSRYQLCGGGTLTLTVNVPENSVERILVYDNERGGNIAAISTAFPYLLILEDIQEDVTYYVASVNGECESERIPLQIEAQARPSLPIANALPTCNLDVIQLDLRQGAIAGDRFHIYATAVAAAPIRVVEVSASRVTINNLGSNEFFVSASSLGNCESGRVRVVVPTLGNLELTTSVQRETCSALGSINAEANNGVPPITYRLFSGGTLTATNTTGVFNNLTAGNYVVEAIDALGCKAISEQMVMGIEVPGPIAFRQSGADLELSWQNIEGVLSYIVQYRFLPNGNFITLNPIQAPVNSARINGLVPNLGYEFQMRAICSAGRQSPITPAQIFTLRSTAEQNCASPSSLSSLNQNNGVLVSWQPVPGALSYNVQYRVLPDGRLILVPSVTASSLLLQNLQSAATYEVTVTANCSNGQISDPSSSLRFTAPVNGGANCAPPSNITVNSASSNSAVISWQPLASGAICYIVSFGVTGSNPETWTQTLAPHPTASIQLTNLQPNLNYSVQLQTNCSLCSTRSGIRSAPSDVVSFTTRPFKEEGRLFKEAFTVYPNPFSSNIIISFGIDSEATASFRILDINGKEAGFYSFECNIGANSAELDLSHLPSGVYLIEADIAAKKLRQKLVKF
jgi:hypothetical protein